MPISIAIATLIDIIAKATERTTAKAAIASEAATALVRREDATGAKRPPNHPLEPRDRNCRISTSLGESPSLDNLSPSTGRIGASRMRRSGSRVCNIEAGS